MRIDNAAVISDTVDVADVIRTLRRQWRAVLSFLAIGVFGALAVVLFAPKRYDGKASVLARAGGPGGGSVLGRMGPGITQLLGSVGGDLGGSMLETELQILKSRVLAAQVVDSFDLQLSVRKPAGAAPATLFQATALTATFAPRKYTFARNGDGSYRVSGDSVPHTVAPGGSVDLAVGRLTLASGTLPPEFTVKVFDEEDAVTRFLAHVEATKAGGEVAKIVYRGEDSVTAAAAPNALIHFYLEQRRTTDRGTNQRRLEYVTDQVNRTEQDLANAERELRRYQEQTHVFEPEVFDKAKLDATGQLRGQLVQIQVEEGSLNQLLAQADKGGLTSRDLVAYPTFMRGSAVGPLAQQLSELEIAKTRLLERRTERDPEVVTIDQSIQQVNANIASMARSYAASLGRQRVALQASLDTAESVLRALPAANERVGRLTRDVTRLTQLYTALQAQLLEARLAAIGEGGDIRQIDMAAVPREPSFPDPFLTMGIGTAGGLVAGIVAALFMAWFGRWLRDPMEIERLTGVSAQRLAADTPLLVGGGTSPRTVLVIPLDERAQARTVAERLARTASVRSLPVHILDFTNGMGNGAGHTSADVDHARTLEQLEQQPGMLVVQLPALSSEATIAALRDTRPVVLVAPPGPVDRVRLNTALDTLRRLNVPCAGIVVSDPPARGLTRALV